MYNLNAAEDSKINLTKSIDICNWVDRKHCRKKRKYWLPQSTTKMHFAPFCHSMTQVRL